MDKEMINLDVDEFLAYFLFYAVNADFGILPEELESIHNHVDHQDLRRIRKAFDEANDLQRLNLIMYYKDLYV
jgi:hypothetical protein